MGDLWPSWAGFGASRFRVFGGFGLRVIEFREFGGLGFRGCLGLSFSGFGVWGLAYIFGVLGSTA